MQFKLLGPLDVSDHGQSVPLGGPRQRAVLAILLLHANEVVPRDVLIDRVWGERPPRSAPHTVEAYVSRLRRALGANRDATRIVTRGRGYMVQVGFHELDVHRFERSLEEGRRALAENDPERARAKLREALSLWRGRPLADLEFEDFARVEVARLEELRAQALEGRIEAELALGRHDGVIAELENAIAQNPLRERLRGQLMLALYRSGRQADALQVYRETRKFLSGELAIEPGPTLKALEKAILRQDPSLGFDGRTVSEAEAARTLAPGRGTYETIQPGFRRVSRRVLIGAAVLAAAIGVIGVAAFGRPGGRADAPVTVSKNSLVVIDPISNRIVRQISVGKYPGPVEAGLGRIWIGNIGAATVSSIDPKSMTVQETVGVRSPIDLAITRDALWIGNGVSHEGPGPPGGGTIQRLPLGPGAPRLIRIGPQILGNEWQDTVASGAGAVWAENGNAATLYRLEPATGKVAARIRGVNGRGIAVGYGHVWVAEPDNNDVAVIDTRTNRLRARIAVPDGPTEVAVGDGAVWVTTQYPRSSIWKIDPRTLQRLGSVEVQPRALRIAADEKGVWVTSNTPGQPGPGAVTRIDPVTMRIVKTFDLGYRPDGVAVAYGRVWVAVAPT